MSSDLAVFSYPTAPNCETYRAVMLAFVAARRRFTVHLRPEDVRDALGPTAELTTISDALGRLESWGNLRADPDTSRVTTVEDFHRARFRYQLTQAGEAVEEALAVYDEAFGRRGSLQAVALTDVATQLRALCELAGEPELDAAKIYLALGTWSTGSPTSPETREPSWARCNARSTCTTPTWMCSAPTRTG